MHPYGEPMDEGGVEIHRSAAHCGRKFPCELMRTQVGAIALGQPGVLDSTAAGNNPYQPQGMAGRLYGPSRPRRQHG